MVKDWGEAPIKKMKNWIVDCHWYSSFRYWNKSSGAKNNINMPRFPISIVLSFEGEIFIKKGTRLIAEYFRKFDR